MPRINVVFDFDGSLATNFVGGMMFRGHASEAKVNIAKERFDSEQTSLRVYQEEVFDLVTESPAEMSKRAAERASIRSLANEVCDVIWDSGGEVMVASAGLDFYIRPVIDNAGLERIIVHSGEVISDPSEPPPFRYDYPSAVESCEGDWVTCKCKVINELKNNDTDDEVIFVGDGTNADECAARNAADTVFATGRLLNYCNKNGIPALEFGDDFKSLLSYVIEKTSANGAQ
ncbi:haloacid dehalogenase-like hydrolase [Dehalococcoides mccartyi]|nr:haloacid dehalogenase-like hydrolase [Dehalococcoides mccartyi]